MKKQDMKKQRNLRREVKFLNPDKLKLCCHVITLNHKRIHSPSSRTRVVAARVEYKYLPKYTVLKSKRLPLMLKIGVTDNIGPTDRNNLRLDLQGYD